MTMLTLPDFTHEDVLSALEQYERDGLPAGFRPSYTYDLLHNGRRYPPPAIAALAAARVTGSVSLPNDVRGGAKTACFRLLRRAGFRVVPKPGIIPFERGHKYSRADLPHHLGTKEDTAKGDWATGYHFYRDPDAGIEGWWFLFPNVGSAGRTGHDYPNEWLTETSLRWIGKTLSRLGQPQVASLLSNAHPVLLFTREHDRDPFTYQGQVKALSVRDGPPLEVVWKVEGYRAGTLTPDEAMPEPADESTSNRPDVDERETVRRDIKARRGQQKFRDELLRGCARRCMISGCDIVDLLEAAHIHPYRGRVDDNDLDNGLLLRCDLHTLFDLGLLGIEPETLTVRLHESVRRPPYAAFDGTLLRLGEVVPRKASLQERWDLFTKEVDS